MELTLFADVAPQSVHCAALAEVKAGELLAVAYAFSYETAPDSRIVAAHFRDGAWTATRTIVDPPGVPVGNPVIAKDPDGRLHLWYVVLHGEQWTEGRIVHAVSDDAGESWSGHAPVHPRPGLMTKGKPLWIGGRVLLPVYDERLWCSHVLIADDAHGPWSLYGDTTARGKTIQPVLAAVSDARILMLSRSTRGRIYRATSENGGYAWTASQPTPLPNPNAGIELVGLSEETLLLAYNPDREGRERLALATSADAGRTWSEARMVERIDGELSYPYAVQGADGTVHLLYTRNRTRVVHRSFNAGELRPRDRSAPPP